MSDQDTSSEQDAPKKADPPPELLWGAFNDKGTLLGLGSRAEAFSEGGRNNHGPNKSRRLRLRMAATPADEQYAVEHGSRGTYIIGVKQFTHVDWVQEPSSPASQPLPVSQPERARGEAAPVSKQESGDPLDALYNTAHGALLAAIRLGDVYKQKITALESLVSRLEARNAALEIKVAELGDEA